jgi:hypothetical protein
MGILLHCRSLVAACSVVAIFRGKVMQVLHHQLPWTRYAALNNHLCMQIQVMQSPSIGCSLTSCPVHLVGYSQASAYISGNEQT